MSEEIKNTKREVVVNIVNLREYCESAYDPENNGLTLSFRPENKTQERSVGCNGRLVVGTPDGNGMVRVRCPGCPTNTKGIEQTFRR